jgi:NAD(P)H-dependent FMN reductase
MKLAVLGGSLRRESLNRRLLEHLARSLEQRGHDLRTLSGDALRLPLFDADLPATVWSSSPPSTTPASPRISRTPWTGSPPSPRTP